jgi:hypothetical protein
MAAASDECPRVPEGVFANELPSLQSRSYLTGRAVLPLPYRFQGGREERVGDALNDGTRC